MKKLLVLLTLFITFVGFSQTKTAIITYKKQHMSKVFTDDKKDKLSKDKLNKFAAIENQTHNIANKLNFTLLYNNGTAIFKADEILDSPDKKFIGMALLPYGHGVYYNSKNERVHQLNSFGEDFLVNYQKSNWKLLSESKKIGNYKVYKATTIEKVQSTNNTQLTYVIEAWYAPEINIPFGPIGYDGLPGLILELTKNKITYYTTNIVLNPSQNIEVKKPNKGKKINEKEFNELAIKAMGNYRKIRN